MTVDPSKGLVQVHPNGKEAKTTFRLMRYDTKSNQSIVKAFPETGRTHQIRVHLQYAGHPIVNDILYNHTAFGVERFKPFVQKELDLEDFGEKLGNSRGWDNEFGYKLKSKSGMAETENQKCKDFERDPLCKKCSNLPADPNHHDLILYLHCFKYAGPDWSFQEIDLIYDSLLCVMEAGLEFCNDVIIFSISYKKSNLPDWSKEDFLIPDYYNRYLSDFGSDIIL